MTFIDVYGRAGVFPTSPYQAMPEPTIRADQRACVYTAFFQQIIKTQNLPLMIREYIAIWTY
jgi:hypothetical protein